MNRILKYIPLAIAFMWQVSSAQDFTISSFYDLQAGNERFRQNISRNCDYSALRQKFSAETTTPTVIVVCDADSRVSPEIIFDCTLGELYVIRTAGGILTADALNAIEFALDKYYPPLIVLLGNLQNEIIASDLNNDPKSPALKDIISKLTPSSSAINGKKFASDAEKIKFIVTENIKNQVIALDKLRAVKEHKIIKQLTVIPCIYDGKTGAVTEISEGDE